MKKWIGALALFVIISTIIYGTWMKTSKKPQYSQCRPPDIGTEYRVIIQTRDERGLHNTCSIEPIDPNEGRIKTMKRLLNRIHKSGS